MHISAYSEVEVEEEEEVIKVMIFQLVLRTPRSLWEEEVEESKEHVVREVVKGDE